MEAEERVDENQMSEQTNMECEPINPLSLDNAEEPPTYARNEEEQQATHNEPEIQITPMEVDLDENSQLSQISRKSDITNTESVSCDATETRDSTDAGATQESTETAKDSTETSSNTATAETPTNTETVETPTNTETAETSTSTETVETPTNTETVETSTSTETIETPTNTETAETSTSTETIETTTNTETTETSINMETAETSSNTETSNPIANTDDGKETVDAGTEKTTTEAEDDVIVITESENQETENKKKDDSESIFPDSCSGSTAAPNENEETTQKEPTQENYIISNCNDDTLRKCMQCNTENVKAKYNVSYKNETTYLCTEFCFNNFKEEHPNNFVKRELRVKVFASQERSSFGPSTSIDYVRKCHECTREIRENEICVAWEALEFCNELCLLKYQKSIGANCDTCHCDIADTTIGKYCVRFGTLLKQFCSTVCLENSKKKLEVCQFCQEDLSLSTKVVEHFCSSLCLMKAKKMKADKKKEKCAVCHEEKDVEIEFKQEDKMSYFCSNPCFVAYKFVNNVVPGQCETCGQYVDKEILKAHSVYYNGLHQLCSKKCQSMYIVTNRKIVLCFWCKVKKYNFDMVEQRGQNGQVISMCSVNCLKIFHISIKAVNSRKHHCDHCKKYLKSMYHLTMSDATTRHFCTYLCLLTYQSTQPQNSIVNVPAKRALAAKKDDPVIKMPVITHVQSLANTSSNSQVNGSASIAEIEKKIKHMVFVKPTPLPAQRNMATMVKPNLVSKGVGVEIKQESRGIQTDEQEKKVIVPIPVPIFVPTPVHMYTQYVPFPVPFVLPVPVPVFIPTTRNSAKGILKEINKIKTKVPTDPLEAELLMMAELVAGDKKKDSDSSSDDDHDNTEAPEVPEKAVDQFATEPVESQSFGEDVLQMALKMASDFEEPVDLEGAVSATTISVPQNPPPEEFAPPPKRRPGRPPKNPKKVPKTETQHMPPSAQLPMEKPDANMCLKYTFGVNAWKQWVTTKNAELEKSSRKVKLFKTEILQLTSDELNYSLCLFVKEVRKPNGTEYAPDTIYYLCLGIQQFLYENGRIDNIFCDAFYEKFTDCLNEVCRKFSVLYNDSQYIVTRVEEEHLWESKQLGAHSPLVLINTLMFFNTKHFSLTTVDEHLQLSFSHIMKHWKRNPNQPGARNVLLRFYPPQTSAETRKKKMYEQQENEENPLRCPVKLYEFYLSKCPESVKTRNDVFYLLPERSCVPDSPLWYSTMPLEKSTLDKMLNRVKMVKEINVALLTT